MVWNEQRGFSLIELMLALTLGTIVLGALLAGLHQTQIWSGNLALLVQRDENLNLTPLLLTRWVSSVGNNLPVEDGQSLEVQSGVLTLRADLSGAAEGFPDGSLDDSFESISLRLEGGKLQLRSGAGSFQTVLEPMETFQALQQTPRILRVELSAVTQGELTALGQTHSASVELFLGLHYQRPKLFEDEE